LDDDGFLFIDGRKDNILVTGTGRNISPEWIENIFNASIMITKSIAFVNNTCEVNLLVVLSPIAESIHRDDLLQRLNQLSQELPFYARPTKVFTTEGTNRECFSENGKPKRKNISMLEGTFKLLMREAA
jgi:long-subunit acyl-CoA synthetase (AMP-forming)